MCFSFKFTDEASGKKKGKGVKRAAQQNKKENSPRLSAAHIQSSGPKPTSAPVPSSAQGEASEPEPGCSKQDENPEPSLGQKKGKGVKRTVQRSEKETPRQLVSPGASSAPEPSCKADKPRRRSARLRELTTEIPIDLNSDENQVSFYNLSSFFF